MNRRSSLRQLVLFGAELPSWESLPAERQEALQEVLSLLLEQLLLQQTGQTVDDPEEHTVEKYHV